MYVDQNDNDNDDNDNDEKVEMRARHTRAYEKVEMRHRVSEHIPTGRPRIKQGTPNRK